MRLTVAIRSRIPFPNLTLTCAPGSMRRGDNFGGQLQVPIATTLSGQLSDKPTSNSKTAI